jgi:hypothetical protein
VPNSFVDMIFLSQRNLRHQKQSEAETQHGDSLRDMGLLHGCAELPLAC